MAGMPSGVLLDVSLALNNQQPASIMSSTSDTMAMPMATTSTASMSMSSTTPMTMAFNTDNLSTLIFSAAWTPSTTGQYVGSWIFIFVLAVIWRALVFAQRRLDQHWIKKYSSPSHTDILREVPGFTHSSSVHAWRLSVNLPRAALAYVAQSISYLLMILVMTMNVGFFFAVTIGYFVGELVFGRPSSK